MQSRNFCCSVCGKVADLLSDPKDDVKPFGTEEEAQKLQQDAQRMADQVAQMRMTAPPAPCSPRVPGSGAGLSNDFLGANMGRNAEAALLVPAEMLDGAATATAVADSAEDMKMGADDSALLRAGAAGIDLDGDGIPDTVDMGGEMPAGTAVDSSMGTTGGGVDLDGDGIVDTDLDFSGAAAAAAQDLSTRSDATFAAEISGGGNPGGGIDFNNDGVADTIDMNTAAEPGGQVDISAAAGAGVGGEELADTLTRGMTLKAEELGTAPADALDNYEGLGLVEQKNVPQCLPCTLGKDGAPVSGVKASSGAAAETGAGSGNPDGTAASMVDTDAGLASTGLRQRFHGNGSAAVGPSSSVRSDTKGTTVGTGDGARGPQQQRLEGAIAHVQGRLNRVEEQQRVEAAAAGALGDGVEGADADADDGARLERDVVDEWLGIMLIALASSMVLMLWRIVARYYTLFL